MKKEQPVKVKIEHTYDYEKFKLIGINRKVDRKHVSNVSESILTRNLLHLFPLVVNEKFEVMDGQHRLTAIKSIEISRQLQLPIYYIMDPDIELDDMRILNSNKVNWKNMDYIHYFASKGNENYKEIIKFMKDHPSINLSTVVSIISSERRDLKVVKAGDFKADKISRGHFIMECAYDLKNRMEPTDTFWKSNGFLLALKYCIDTKKYQHHIMMQSKHNNREHWMRQINTHAYLYEINKIYNYHLSAEEKVDFMKLTRRKY